MLAAALAPALALTACLQEDATGGDSGGGSAEGVPADATKEEYAAAFEDLEPQTITLQSPAPPGEGSSRVFEAYKEDLAKWSGGKLTLEISYSNSIASPTEVPQAMAEGRLDMDYIYPLYEPSRFPKNAAFADIAFAGNHSPVVGTLSAWAGLMEAGLQEEELAQEFEQKGLKMLLPFAPNTSVGMLCREPKSTLEDLEGAQVRVSGGVQDEQVEALGANPVSLPYAEQYQALQRGTIDCALSAAYAAEIIGIIPVAPNFTTGADTGFSRVAAPYAFGLQKWESMALPYRQLIFDRMVTIVEGLISLEILQGSKSALEQATSEGGEIQQLGDEANAALEQKNQELLSQLGEGDTFEETSLSQDAVEALEKWRGIAVDMGYTDASFSEWAESGDASVDISPFVERFWDDVFSEYRPE